MKSNNLMFFLFFSMVILPVLMGAVGFLVLGVILNGYLYFRYEIPFSIDYELWGLAIKGGIVGLVGSILTIVIFFLRRWRQM